MYRGATVGLPARAGLGVATGLLLIGLAGATSARHAAAESTGAAGAQTTITCTLSIDAPHRTAHAPLMVKIVSNWSCTAPVTSLTTSVKLMQATQVVAQKQCSNTGVATLRCGVATACVSGSYTATATGTAVFPPGFQPPSITLTVNSGPVTITC